MSTWTIVTCFAARDAALKCARGCYQRNLVEGRENLSGSTLRGKAKTYSSRYSQSRTEFLRRLTLAGVEWHETIGAHGARLLVLGPQVCAKHDDCREDLALAAACHASRVSARRVAS